MFTVFQIDLLSLHNVKILLRYIWFYRYAAPADRFAGGDRYSRGSDRYPPASYDKARSFERDVVPSAGSDRYGGGRAGGPIRGGDEGRGFRSRASGPYERPSRSSGGGGYPSSSTFDRY